MAGAKDGRNKGARDDEHFRQRLDELGERIGKARGASPEVTPVDAESRGRALWPSDHYGVLADLIVFPPSTGATGRADVRWARAPEPPHSKAP